MEPLSTFDLVMNFLVVIVMPLLILANLRNFGRKSPLKTYLWNEHPNFMRVSLVVIGLLMMFSVTGLLGYYGLVSPTFVEYAAPVLAILFLIVALAEIWLSIAVLRKYFRTRKAGRTTA